jgi:predicted acetyltransferase
MNAVRSARPDEYQQIMSFLEEAYKSHKDFFPEKYPAAWRRENTDYDHVFIIMQEDKIVSLVRLFPLPLSINKIKINIAGIGAVATAPACRGQGHMERLMQHTIEVMRREKYPVSVLWGDRHRYQTFGYENAGKSFDFVISTRGLSKCGLRPVKPVLFAGEPDILSQVKRIYDANVYHLERTPRYWEAVYQRNNLRVFWSGRDVEFGYLALYKDEKTSRLCEFGGKTETVLGLAAQVMEQEKIASLTFSWPDMNTVPNLIFKAAAHWSMTHTCMLKIIDLQEVYRLLLPKGANAADVTGRSDLEQAHLLFGTHSESPLNMFIPALDHV